MNLSEVGGLAHTVHPPLVYPQPLLETWPLFKQIRYMHLKVDVAPLVEQIKCLGFHVFIIACV